MDLQVSTTTDTPTEQKTPLLARLALQLDAFEGPLDLLLHVIRKQDIDIFDIPVHEIAEDFQECVGMLHTLDLEQAGDYLSMAAELAHIKSRMLLPKFEDPEGEEDPRSPLVQRLLEYEQVQKAAEYLDQCRHLGRDVFLRGNDASEGVPQPPMPLANIKPLELRKVLDQLLKKAKRKGQLFHKVEREVITVRQRILWLCQRLKRVGQVRFSQLHKEPWGRATTIATFLALLELSRLKRIRLHQVEGADLELEPIGSLEDIPLQAVEDFMGSVVSEAKPPGPKKRKAKKRKVTTKV